MSNVVGDVAWDAMLKELYPPGLPQDLMLRNHPFMSLVPKDDNATGEYMVIPVIYDLPPGRSADPAQVFNSTTGPVDSSKHTKFTPKLFEDYAATYLNMLTVYKTANDRGSFVEARKMEIDGILTQLGNSLAHALFRDGTGAVGQVNSAVASTTITLTTRSDAKFFVVNGQYALQTGPTPVVHCETVVTSRLLRRLMRTQVLLPSLLTCRRLLRRRLSVTGSWQLVIPTTR